MNKINVGDLLLVKPDDERNGGSGIADDANILFIYKEDVKYFYYKNLTQNYESFLHKEWFEEDLQKGYVVKL